jgi:hypothetical protein
MSFHVGVTEKRAVMGLAPAARFCVTPLCNTGGKSFFIVSGGVL